MNGIGAIGGGGVSVKDVMALRQQIFDRSQLLRGLQQPAASTATQGTQEAAGTAGFGDTLRQALSKIPGATRMVVGHTIQVGQTLQCDRSQHLEGNIAISCEHAIAPVASGIRVWSLPSAFHIRRGIQHRQ